MEDENSAAIGSSEVGEAVSTPMGRRIGEIWASALGVDEVGPDDDFFALGGDSMILMMVLARIREEFNVEFKPNEVFRSPSLRDFCEVVAGARKVDPDDGAFEDGFI